jgi:hypothetical protein
MVSKRFLFETDYNTTAALLNPKASGGVGNDKPLP